MNPQSRIALSCTLAFALAGCLTNGDPQPGPGGPNVAIDIASLNLAGVGDVVWDVEVTNGDAAPVWTARLTSSGYGDGAGSASYVGPCDASAGVALNTVSLWVVGIYAGPVASAGEFHSGAATGVGAVVGASLAFQNPTASGALTQQVTCSENADAQVRFDVALLRPANQGFFDVAVNFDDIFCSAKFDCEAGALLHDEAGVRGPTMVLAFACTAGPSNTRETTLYLDAIALDCTTPTAQDFAADIRIDPSGPAGNQCVAGQVGAGQCAAVAEESGVDAGAFLYQVALYRGAEALVSGGVDAQKVYWNAAFGVRAAIAGCWLRTRGTAVGAGSPWADSGTIAAGVVYPYVQWDVPLDAGCGEAALSFDDPAADVRAEYTGTSGEGLSFAYGYGKSRPAGAFCDPACAPGARCVAGSCVCDDGFYGAACEPCTPVAGCAAGAVSCTDATDSVCATCDNGLGGDDCTEPLCTAPCENGGVCTAPDTCTCAAGWTGPTCTEPDGSGGGGEFITVWDTTRTSGGSTANNRVRLPLDQEGIYDFHVDWGDGSTNHITHWNNSAREHIYASPGEYTVTITGTITGWRFGWQGDRLKLLEVVEWGPLRLGNRGGYFAGAENMTISATDPLDISDTSNMYQAFLQCRSLTHIPGLEAWDVAHVTTLGRMFEGAVVFSQDIGGWDTSAVTTIDRMFYNASAFDNDIGTWDVRNVTHMAQTFWGASRFNRDIGGWDVGQVVTMNGMFRDAAAFNQDIGGWNVTNVTTMYDMFHNAEAFNQDIGGWDVGEVTTMANMFDGAAAFDQNLYTWDIANVSDMALMFRDATLSTANYDALLIGWNAHPETPTGVPFHGGNSRYSAAAEGARANLRDPTVGYGWTIQDGGLAP